MSRRQFIEAQGATCRNWQWSWSFINEIERRIIFGAWDRNTEGRRSLIFSKDWKINDAGKKNAGYSQSREHIRLIEDEGYELFTFPMKYSEAKKDDDGLGPAKLEGFTPELSRRRLIGVGGSWYASDGLPITRIAEELLDAENLLEGAKKTVVINSYERNRIAREACILHHGVRCAACDFKFVEMYGDIGEGFIHVHHISPISEVGEGYRVDPIKDLTPVCPNCHAMIHTTRPPLTIAQLRSLIGVAR